MHCRIEKIDKSRKFSVGVDIEFKELDRKTRKLPENVSKEIGAFMNTKGGELYIGVATL